MRKLLCPILALAFLFGATSIPVPAAAPPDKDNQVVKADKKEKKGKKGKKGGKKKGGKKGKRKAAEA